MKSETNLAIQYLQKLKVALVYDRVNTPYGGAENVLLELHKLFPQAPLFTSLYDEKKAKWAKVFNIKTSFLQNLPFFLKNHRLLAPLMPMAFESLDFSEFELIISITSAEAKGVITKPHQHHICYLLTPPRYLYSHQSETIKSNRWFNNFLGKKIADFFLNYLIWWDQTAIHRPDLIIPISQRVVKRVKKYYSLEVDKIVYPPINVRKRKLGVNKEYFLIVSRLVYYKKIDLAIKACQKIGVKLIIVGNGPEFDKLKSIANSNIIFQNTVSAKKLEELYENSIGLIMVGEEDFGIVALEANAHGKPVAIYHKSGASELIDDKIHGIHIKNQTVSAVVDSVHDMLTTKFDPQILVKNALKYDTNRYRENFIISIYDFFLSKGIKI